MTGVTTFIPQTTFNWSYGSVVLYSLGGKDVSLDVDVVICVTTEENNSRTSTGVKTAYISFFSLDVQE